MPDVIGDHTAPEVISITTSTTQTVDPKSYITATVSPCQAFYNDPQVVAVSAPFNTVRAAKVAKVDPTTFVIDIDPATHSGGDTSDI